MSTATEKLFLSDSYQRQFDARVVALTPVGIVLDRTCFYASSGGQPGDTGTIGGTPVTDTVKNKEAPDQIVHVVADPAQFTVGQNVACAIDWDRRYAHMRLHTTLHLVCSLIKGYATGNQIAADKARIDFDVEMADLDRAELTEKLNAVIARNLAVSTTHVDEAELDRNPELVRTLSVQPPRGCGTIRMVTIGDAAQPVDRQPCGGTHVANTSEIGPVTFTKIENKGRQNKRLIIALGSGLSAQAA